METKLVPLIVEDDPLAQKSLTYLLSKTNMFQEAVVCGTVTEAFEFLNRKTADIIFLDIDLPDLSGLELLKLFPSYSPVVVTSSHVELAVDCFDFNVVDFLSKPFTYTRLLRSIQRAIKKIPEQTVSMAEKTPDKNYIFLPAGRSTVRFNYSDIIYIEAYGVYVKIITPEGIIVVNQMLSHIEEALSHDHFLRIHRSFLVNLDHINRIATNEVRVSTYFLPIGMSYKDKVTQKLKSSGLINE
ncbi:LytR/AlgR family response regulator transcription factor [Runella slithyformis]|uniref:Two component transcriptional regulator, LytTR family n=1 Tax=Runella slithyformis (strain ATCC 29530 / DSM 19594 / LMG 11500 / NCIMB 11436 / LSU 4) TaxID=761193 RepID=A0A7U3ZN19_RUNSL|nr:LytTR family DNA-binding domain-containing protein [Runella slithyformis]AEI50241.1 two component transcriptional regulator, LytTR family [Runella slithyformis DSM 19594]